MSVSSVCSCLSCPTHRGSVERPACGFYPSSSMTDRQWALLEPLLPPPGNTGGHGGRPEKHPRRRVLDAIFYLVRGGIAWLALPAEFPPAKTVYGVFRRWVRAGAWTRLHAALRARFSTIALIWADGGYAGRLVRWAQAVLGFAVTIVKRTDDLAGFQVIPRRWVVERTLAWISKHRRCVRDYETLPEHSEAMVYIAMIMTMSRRLAR